MLLFFRRVRLLTLITHAQWPFFTQNSWVLYTSHIDIIKDNQWRITVFLEDTAFMILHVAVGDPGQDLDPKWPKVTNWARRKVIMRLNTSGQPG